MCTMWCVVNLGNRHWPSQSVMDPHSRTSSLQAKQPQQGEKDIHVYMYCIHNTRTKLYFCVIFIYLGCLVHSLFPWWCVLLSWRCQTAPSLTRPAVKMSRYVSHTTKVHSYVSSLSLSLSFSNGQPLDIELIVYDAESRAFDNFTSLLWRWTSSDQQLLPTPQITSLAHHEGKGEKYMYYIVHVHVHVHMYVHACYA